MYFTNIQKHVTTTVSLGYNSGMKSPIRRKHVRRDIQLQVRLTPAESAAVDLIAGRMGLSRSDWFRHVIELQFASALPLLDGEDAATVSAALAKKDKGPRSNE